MLKNWAVFVGAGAVVRRCSVKKLFLEISQNSQEKACARVSLLIKLQGWGLRPAALLKKRPWYKCFPVNFSKFLRKSFFIEHLWWLLLSVTASAILMIIAVHNSEFCFAIFLYFTIQVLYKKLIATVWKLVFTFLQSELFFTLNNLKWRRVLS